MLPDFISDQLSYLADSTYLKYLLNPHKNCSSQVLSLFHYHFMDEVTEALEIC